ncbi:MAG: restriction endonuclease, partial [Ruminococcus champanellensis]|nr:restriction endonuclease [Ruminococcus champanellensis]
FYKVTSITLDQFRFLRDGGSYTDAETGEEKHYPGKLFDPVVFDDSIKEFLSLRTRLGNYFDESHTEDIFDYIPPQKTNQIFTPKRIVKQMVDMLEQENPGCFEDPNKTFADLYMKSGLYIAEIVKRLFNSNGMKQAFPDETQRLQHIFENQVYGLAPTEIIYQIALHFILGFEGGELIEKHHLRQCDALPLAKDGTLETKLDSIFG